MNAVASDTFKGKSSFSTHHVKGVSLSVTNKHKPQLISDFNDPEIDAVFVQCTIQKMSTYSFLLLPARNKLNKITEEAAESS